MKYLLLLALLFLPQLALAATLYLSPSSGTYEVGKTVTVSVYLSSADQAANAVSGNVSVPSDLFSVVSASSAGSVVNFWVSEPKVQGSTVSLEGVILNPGYQGAAGKVASITLSPKKAGTGSLSFSSASVLANDGQGTDILSGTTGATFSVGGTTATPTQTQTVQPTQAAEPSAFPITSTTHPAEDGWYRQTTGTFSWSVPEGATATRLILSSSRSAAPSVEYSPAIATKTIQNIPEGISYLRVQHRVGGVWGGIGTYRIQIDTTPPEPFFITFPHGLEDINPQPVILFNTFDELSGVERYDVRVGEGDILVAAADTDSNPYALPMQEPGAHVVIVTAFDGAGNARTQSETFFIEGIDPPKITYYAERVNYLDLVRVRGITYTNTQVEVYVRDEDGELMTVEPTKSNALGDFVLILTKRLEPGTYALTARSTDARGARSPESEAVAFVVDGNLFTDLGFFMRDYGSIFALILFVFVACFAVHVYGWRRLLILTHGVHAQRAEAATTVHKAFAILKKDVASHMRKIRAAGEKRVLTKEEVAFLEEFEGELDEAEAAVEREMRRAKEH